MNMNKRRGQSLIEIMVAVVIIVIAISASAAVLTATERSTGELFEQTRAVALAEEGIQVSISIGDRSWTDLATGTHGLAVQASPAQWIFQGSSDVADGFTRTVTVSDYDSNTKKIVVLVTWHPAVNRTAAVEEQMLFTNWASL